MTKPEFAKMAALVVRMRKDLESHTEAHVKSETETMAIDKDAQQTDEAVGDWRSRSYDIYLMDCGQLTREVRVINGRIAQVDGFSGDLIGYPLKDCPLEGEAIVIGDLMGGTLRDPFHIDDAPVLISSVVELQSDAADPGAEAAQDLSQEGCAQCAEYLRANEQLHSELVTVRAALASVSAERDSYKRTLDEWSNADTAPHERVGAEDIADHVVPPVLNQGELDWANDERDEKLEFRNVVPTAEMIALCRWWDVAAGYPRAICFKNANQRPIAQLGG